VADSVLTYGYLRVSRRYVKKYVATDEKMRAAIQRSQAAIIRDVQAGTPFMQAFANRGSAAHAWVLNQAAAQAQAAQQQQGGGNP
jgi:hypothetical protein